MFKHSAPQSMSISFTELIRLYPDRLEPSDDGMKLVLHDPAEGPPATRLRRDLLINHHRSETLVAVEHLNDLMNAVGEAVAPQAVAFDFSPAMNLAT